MIRHALFASLFAAFAACSAFAQEPEKPASPDQQAMMEAWQKAAAATEIHQRIMKLAGTFNVKSQFRMGAGEAEQTSEGKTINTPILGGRFLQGEFSGQMMGAPFKGIYVWGFDNLRQRHVAAWMDDMSTAMMHGYGTADTAGKVITWQFEHIDPLTKKTATCRHVTTIESDDRYTYEIFDQSPDGKEFRGVLLSYERAR
jgi:hypothetical protein